MTENINLVVMGGFTYPCGMAGTKRVQNVISALRECGVSAIRVFVLRQAAKDNMLSGIHDGTPYETIMGDYFRARMLAALPLLYCKAFAALKKAFREDHKNILYFYGPLFFDSIVPLIYARRLGYKLVFDVIEDYDLSKDLSVSVYQSLRCSLTIRFSKAMKNLAAGVIAISSHLENKFRNYDQGRIPIHYLPISVDMNQFPGNPCGTGPVVSLFYAGSFTRKDGVPVLLDAFDELAERYGNIRLILTGRGDRLALQAFLERVESSPHKDRIEYKGYLEEKDYYSLLNSVDIPCMTRVDIGFAQAGFPFKLGEFLATGKPVIASVVSDVDRFLVNGHTAMLVTAGSSREICEAVEFLVNNPESASAIGARGREVAESAFDYKKQGRALLTFLENV